MNTTANPAIDYGQHYRSAITRLPGSKDPWLQHRREAALDRLEQQGFPTLKQEDWRYTNIRPILDEVFEPAIGPVRALEREDIEHLMPGDERDPCLVLVNGYLDTGLSRMTVLPGGVLLDGMLQCLEKRPDVIRSQIETLSPGRHAFHALNAAAGADGVILQVPEGVELERPVHILHLALEVDGPVSALPLNRIEIGPGAGARVNEYFASTGGSRYLSNARTLIRIGPEARLTHGRIQDESPAAFHLSSVDVTLEAGASYRGHNLALGGRIGRSEIDVSFLGEDARCRIDGLYLAQDGQVQDFHTRVEHEPPNCGTQQNFKGILSGRGRGVFDGRIQVHPGAQKTDAHMRNDNLLLSRNAEVDTKPQLLIYADDVKCSHGATVGELDKNALFYLRSRGIPAHQARRMLTRGFALDLLAAVTDFKLRQRMETALVERLERVDV